MMYPVWHFREANSDGCWPSQRSFVKRRRTAGNTIGETSQRKNGVHYVHGSWYVHVFSTYLNHLFLRLSYFFSQPKQAQRRLLRWMRFKARNLSSAKSLVFFFLIPQVGYELDFFLRRINGTIVHHGTWNNHRIYGLRVFCSKFEAGRNRTLVKQPYKFSGRIVVMDFPWDGPWKQPC